MLSRPAVSAERPLLPWLLASLTLHLAALAIPRVELSPILGQQRPALLLRIKQLAATEAVPEHWAGQDRPRLSSAAAGQTSAHEGSEKLKAAQGGGESGSEATSVPDRARELARLGRAAYEQLLAARLERYKRYPTAAARRGLEGQALLRLVISRDGAVVDRAIIEPSPSDILDRAALAMVARAAPLPAVPRELAGSRFEFEVPVSFRLD